MSAALRLAAAVMLLCFLVYMLRELGSSGAKPLAVLGSVLLSLCVLSGVGKLFSALRLAEISSEVASLMGTTLKIIGVGYLFGFVSDFCRDLGEGGVASMTQVAGRVEILLLATPYIKEAISLAGEMMK